MRFSLLTSRLPCGPKKQSAWSPSSIDKGNWPLSTGNCYADQCHERLPAECILCLIFSHLIIILLVQCLLALVSVRGLNEKLEFSFGKATQWLMRGRLLKAVLERLFKVLPRRMVSRWKRLLKQNRKCLTTWQLITEQVAFLDSFADLGYLVRQWWADPSFFRLVWCVCYIPRSERFRAQQSFHS